MQDATSPGVLNRRVMRNITNAAYRFPAEIDLSPECLDFVSKVLVTDPEARLTAEEMRDHPWLAGKLLPQIDPSTESAQTVFDIQAVMGESSATRWVGE